MAGEIDNPGLKQTLWHSMRGDLGALMPDILHSDQLMCPACGRFLAIDDFNIEHIVPQQALDDDPHEVRAAISRNERGVTTLLCKRNILIGNKLRGNGCNGWKGRYFDRYLNDVFHAKLVEKTATTQHQVAFFVACHLALFSRYGYQVSLSEWGIICRKQFFSSEIFVKQIPTMSKAFFFGKAPEKFNHETRSYWAPPFKFEFEDGFCLAGARNAAMYIPVSRNPETPIASLLPYAPSKYIFRPDFSSVLDS